MKALVHLRACPSNEAVTFAVKQRWFHIESSRSYPREPHGPVASFLNNAEERPADSLFFPRELYKLDEATNPEFQQPSQSLRRIM